MTPTATVAVGLLSLAASALAAGAAVFAPSRRRLLGGVAALLALASATLFVVVLAGHWAGGGMLPNPTRFEACLETLAGVSLATAFLAGIGIRGDPAGEGTVPPFLAACASALTGAAVALLALRFDHEPHLAAPAVQTALAPLHYALRWTSLGILLAASGAACASLLDRGAVPAARETWDGLLERTVALGLPAYLVSLVVAAVWHRDIWSSPWQWELSETWSLATLLVFVVWLHVQRVPGVGPRAGAALLAAGGAVLAGWLTYVPSLPGAMDSRDINPF